MIIVNKKTEEIVMAEYCVDWETIKKVDAPALIDAVARYASAQEFADIKDVYAILGIKKKEVEEELNGSY